MRSRRHELEALKRILRRAYHEKENLEVGEQWQLNVMRRIRDLGPIKSRPDFFMLFEQLVWRVTPATCLLIIALVIIFLDLDFSPQYEVFTSFIYDTGEVTLAQLFEF